ncbi:MAG: prolyl oligopeptidase family serine peptidase [Saprospiraceae bacterium]
MNQIRFSFLLPALLSGIFACTLQAQTTKPETALIPRRSLFLFDKSIGNVQMSPDGQWVAFQKGVGAGTSIVVQPAEAAGEEKRIEIVGPSHGTWAWTQGNALLYLDREGESWALMQRKPESQEARDLTPFEFKSARILASSPDRPDEIAIGFQSGEPEHDGIFILSMKEKTAAKVADWEDCSNLYFDNALRLRAATRPNENMAHTLLRRSDDGKWIPIADYTWSLNRISLTPEGVVSVSADGNTLWFTDSEGEDKAVLKRCDLRNGNVKKVLESPRADLYWLAAAIHPRSGEPQALASWFGEIQRFYLDKSLKKDFDWLNKQHNGDVSLMARSNDDSRWLIRYLNGAPTEHFIYLRPEQKLVPLFSDFPQGDHLEWATRHPFPVKARDGLQLPCHYYLPADSDSNGDGLPDRPLPTVLYVHGGPWVGNMQNNWYITRQLQLLANRGYAVVWAEFRGVASFGKKFVDAGNLEWGGKMHTDLLDIAKAATDKGIAAPGKTAIWGWSYGGYATATALAFAPEAFVCGISMYGVYDLESFCKLPFADSDIWRTRTGNVHTAEGVALLRKHSPVHYVKNITKPYLLTHGGRDERTPLSQTDSLAAGLRAGGKQFSYFYYPEEPHDYRQPESWQSFWAVAEEFLQRYLGGAAEPATDELERADLVLQDNYLQLNTLKNYRAPDEDWHTVRMLNNDLENAMRRADLQGVADLYADDAQLIAGKGYVTTGREAIDRYWNSIRNPMDWNLDVITVGRTKEQIFEHPYWKALKNKPPLPESYPSEALYQLGKSTLTYRRNDTDEPHSSVVDFFLVWAPDTDGNWKVAVDSYVRHEG